MSKENKRKTAAPLIGFENVCFQHDSNGWKVRDLCLYLEQGKRVGVLGGNESGKTTIGRLFKRVLNPTGGRIVFRHEVGDVSALVRRAFCLRVIAIVTTAVFVSAFLLQLVSHLIGIRVIMLPRPDSLVSFAVLACSLAVAAIFWRMRSRVCGELAIYDESVVYVNSEDNVAQKLDNDMLIEECLTRHTKGSVSPETARQNVSIRVEDVLCC